MSKILLKIVLKTLLALHVGVLGFSSEEIVAPAASSGGEVLWQFDTGG